MPSKNVLMIAVDDLNSWVTFRDNYAGEICAPNLERLMSMGTNFANAFCQTAVCNPSRASVLTGKAPASTGVYDNSMNWYDVSGPHETLPAALRQSGYHTVNIGKVFHDPDALPKNVQSILFDQHINEVGEKESRGESPLNYGVAANEKLSRIISKQRMR